MLVSNLLREEEILMKKIFTEAEVEIKAFEMEDVITASSGDDDEPPVIENIGNCI